MVDVIRILSLAGLLSSSSLAAAKLKVECLGPPTSEAKTFLVYLHGFEELKSQSAEELANRKTLQAIAKDLKVRIAIPEGPACPKARRCWPAADPDIVLATFAQITEARKSCFVDRPYSLVGFSNGGYFAFKLYKAHKDPQLTTIIASSSSGLWDPGRDQPNPLSRFSLMIGDRDITRRDAESFMARFRKSEPKSSLKVFRGGHIMDEKTLRTILGDAKS